MIGELIIGVGTVTAAGVAYARRQRIRLYRNLQRDVARIVDARALDLGYLAQRKPPQFVDRFAVLPDLLSAGTFVALKAEAERLVAPERSFVPVHKKGGTVAYETLIASAPTVVSFYHCADFQDFISRLVGARVRPTPIHDQSSLSVLFYDKPGDHIGWHYDHNFYRGRHFTVLISLINERHGTDQPSSAQLVTRRGRHDETVPMPPNTLVLFEGAQVLHKVTPLGEGETRVTLSMTFCTDPAAPLWKAVARRFKDVAFFGVRALWT